MSQIKGSVVVCVLAITVTVRPGHHQAWLERQLLSSSNAVSLPAGQQLLLLTTSQDGLAAKISAPG